MTTATSDSPVNLKADLKGISSMATRQVLAAVVELFKQQSGRSFRLESVGGVDAAKRVQAGEVFDVVILASDAIDKLVASGHVIAGSRVDLVTSPISVAVKSGATRADVTRASNLREALLAAATVSYSTGPSGVYLAKLFKGMGISEQMKSKTIVPPPGVPVGSLVASGEVEMGLQQRSELINVQGVEIIGNLPDEVAYTTTFSAGVPSNAPEANKTAIQDFLKLANSAQAVAIKQAQGMNPI